ncbi:hypothetical protein [Brucella tritici]|uniref:hypothetical protein n=1 Tax=Brucella tritici TaxID=94626 RepID=UPI002000AD71|nr:hypothetical protein [Brucella tritici]
MIASQELWPILGDLVSLVRIAAERGKFSVWPQASSSVCLSLSRMMISPVPTVARISGRVLSSEYVPCCSRLGRLIWLLLVAVYILRRQATLA